MVSDIVHGMVSKIGVAAIVITCIVALAVAIGLGVYATRASAVSAPDPPLEIARPHCPPVLTPTSSRSMLSQSPQLETIALFLTEAEADAVIELASDRFQRSHVVEEKTGVQHPDPSRTSHSVYLKYGETPLVKEIEARAAAVANIPRENLERLQVVRYEFGQFYKSHFDYLPITDDVTMYGQRQATLFVYLNDLPTQETGGGTHFETLKKTIRPKKGTAAFWMNMTPDGNVDPRTLHGGETIQMPGTVKYGMNIWFRTKAQPR